MKVLKNYMIAGLMAVMVNPTDAASSAQWVNPYADAHDELGMARKKVAETVNSASLESLKHGHSVLEQKPLDITPLKGDLRDLINYVQLYTEQPLRREDDTSAVTEFFHRHLEDESFQTQLTLLKDLKDQLLEYGEDVLSMSLEGLKMRDDVRQSQMKAVEALVKKMAAFQLNEEASRQDKLLQRMAGAVGAAAAAGSK